MPIDILYIIYNITKSHFNSKDLLNPIYRYQRKCPQQKFLNVGLICRPPIDEIDDSVTFDYYYELWNFGTVQDCSWLSRFETNFRIFKKLAFDQSDLSLTYPRRKDSISSFSVGNRQFWKKVLCEQKNIFW